MCEQECTSVMNPSVGEEGTDYWCDRVTEGAGGWEINDSGSHWETLLPPSPSDVS